MTEKQFQKQVSDWLKAQGIPHMIITSGAYMARGISDIIGTLPTGRALYLEIKKTGGVASAEQRNFIERHSLAGAMAYVVYPERTFRDAVYKGQAQARPIDFETLQEKIKNEMVREKIQRNSGDRF